MNLDWVKPALDLITKANPLAMAIICLLTAVLLFAPASFVSALGLADWVAQWRGALGAAFLCSVGMLAFTSITRLTNRKPMPRVITLQERLDTLEETELRLLMHFLQANERVLTMSSYTPGLAGLLRAGLVVRSVLPGTFALTEQARLGLRELRL